jgi:tetratricopeptide (TPR) repeat protein
MAMLLALCLSLSGMVLAQTQEDKNVYDTAKKSIYAKDYESAIERLEYLLGNYQDSRYYPDSLYWLGYSLHKLGDSLGNMEQGLEAKEKSIARLNNLIVKYKDSAWLDDARILRIKVAEDLVEKGLSDYRVYINGSLLATEELEEMEEQEGLGGVLALGELEGLEGVLTLESLGGSLDRMYALGDVYSLAGAPSLYALEGLEGLSVLGISSDQDEQEKDPELELKLVALQALLSVDSEKAFPILLKIVNEEDNPKLRRNAIFVLSRSKHPEVLPHMAK